MRYSLPRQSDEKKNAEMFLLLTRTVFSGNERRRRNVLKLERLKATDSTQFTCQMDERLIRAPPSLNRKIILAEVAVLLIRFYFRFRIHCKNLKMNKHFSCTIFMCCCSFRYRFFFGVDFLTLSMHLYTLTLARSPARSRLPQHKMSVCARAKM